MEDRALKLAALRKSLAAYDTQMDAGVVERLSPSDAALGCPLPRDALHEVYALDASFGTIASGFAAGLALRLGGNRPLVWITTDYAVLEFGAPTGNGFLEFGIDPRRVIALCLRKGEDALRAAGDVLSNRYVGALVLEIPGRLKALDLTATRRISLAASDRNVPAILLRLGAAPEASTAETRWLVHAATSSPVTDDDDWGRPAFTARLLRNRHGQLGEWRMEWDGEHGFFRSRDIAEPTPHPVGVVSPPADGPSATEAQRAIG